MRLSPRSDEVNGAVRVGIAPFALMLLLSLLFIAAVAWWIGAFGQEFFSDAAGHYVTGLAIHDLVFAGGIANPLSFLIDYFVHYPAIGLGHWPPAFYVLEALWMAIFGWTKISVLLLAALISAAASASVFAASAGRWGVLAGILGAAIFLASPLVLQTFGALMTDVLVALLCFLAALAFLMYMERGWAGWAGVFAVLAAAAILTKGNAMMLALFPALSIALARRFDLLRRPSLWCAAAIVGILILPWYAVTYSWTAKGFLYQWGVEYSWLAVRSNALALIRGLGWGGMLLFAVGAIQAFRGGRYAVALQVCLALAISSFLFQAIVPTALVARYMLPGFLPMVVVAAAGAAFIYERFPRPLVVWPGVFLLALAPLLFSQKSLARAAPWGLQEVVATAMAEAPHGNPVILASVGPNTESAIIAEIAQRDARRPSFVVLRGSRLLGGGGFMKQDYLPRYRDIQDVLNAIRKYRVPVIVLEQSPEASQWVHNAQVRELVAASATTFQVVQRLPSQRGGEFWVIRVTEHIDAPADWEALRALGRPQREMPGS